MSVCPNCGSPTESDVRAFKLCQECKKERYNRWADKNRDKIRTYYQQWQKDNKKELATYQKKWRMKKHKEKNDK